MAVSTETQQTLDDAAARNAAAGVAASATPGQGTNTRRDLGNGYYTDGAEGTNSPVYDASGNQAGYSGSFTLPGASASGIIQNTNDTRSTTDGVKKNATDLYGAIVTDPNAYTPFGQTTGGTAAETKVAGAEQGIKNSQAGAYTPAQQSRITDAENKAKASYEPMLKEAQAQKDQGLPKAIVNAGQIGGLMNTQFAGVAALLPTQGGSFVGAGGMLERIASAYDRNIEQVQTTMTSAITEARSAAQRAIETGAKEDYDLAQNSYTRAKEAYDQGLVLAQKKQEDITKAKDRAISIQKGMREQADATMENLAKAGVALTPEEAHDLAPLYNMSADAVLSLNKANIDAEKLKTETNQLTANALRESSATHLWEALDKVPAGQKVTVGKNTYYGTQGTGKLEVNETTGMGYQFNVDQTTGKIQRRDLGYVGSAKDGFVLKYDQYNQPWNVNDITGQKFPMSAAKGNWNEVLPNGEVYVSPKRGADGQIRQKECGVFVNDMTGIGFGNSLYADPAKNDPGKVSKIDKSIGGDGNPVQVGDAFVQAIGGWTGHVGIVEEVRMQDGKVVGYTVKDSNRNGDGKIGESFISANDKTLLGFARGNLAPALQTGTDAPPTNYEPKFTPTAKKGDNERLTPAEVKTLTDQGYKVTFGMTQGEAAKLTGPEGGAQALTKEQKDKIAVSDDGKKLIAMNNLSKYLDEYEKLVKNVGVESFPTTSKKRMEQLEKLMIVEQKNISGLGALASADMTLVSSILPSATTGFWGGVLRGPAAPLNALGIGKTQATVQAQIDGLRQANGIAKDNAKNNLTAQYSGNTSDPYLKQLFGDTNTTSGPQPDKSSFPAGTDVEAAKTQGYTVEPQADGTFLIWK